MYYILQTNKKIFFQKKNTGEQRLEQKHWSGDNCNNSGKRWWEWWRWKKWSYFRFIFKVKWTEFADRLDMWCEEQRRAKGELQDFCLSKTIMGKSRFRRDIQFSFGFVDILVASYCKLFCIFYFQIYVQHPSIHF